MLKLKGCFFCVLYAIHCLSDAAPSDVKQYMKTRSSSKYEPSFLNYENYDEEASTIGKASFLEYGGSSVQSVQEDAIEWQDCPFTQALLTNSDGKILCRVLANPPVTLTWTKNSHGLDPKYTVESDGIWVTGVEEEDQGIYSLKAVVPKTGRCETRLIRVEVLGPAVSAPTTVDYMPEEEMGAVTMASPPHIDMVSPPQTARVIGIFEGPAVSAPTTVDYMPQEEMGAVTMASPPHIDMVSPPQTARVIGIFEDSKQETEASSLDVPVWKWMIVIGACIFLVLVLIWLNCSDCSSSKKGGRLPKSAAREVGDRIKFVQSPPKPACHNKFDPNKKRAENFC